MLFLPLIKTLPGVTIVAPPSRDSLEPISYIRRTKRIQYTYKYVMHLCVNETQKQNNKMYKMRRIESETRNQVTPKAFWSLNLPHVSTLKRVANSWKSFKIRRSDPAFSRSDRVLIPLIPTTHHIPPTLFLQSIVQIKVSSNLSWTLW